MAICDPADSGRALPTSRTALILQTWTNQIADSDLTARARWFKCIEHRLSSYERDTVIHALYRPNSVPRLLNVLVLASQSRIKNGVAGSGIESGLRRALVGAASWPRLRSARLARGRSGMTRPTRPAGGHSPRRAGPGQYSFLMLK